MCAAAVTARGLAQIRPDDRRKPRCRPFPGEPRQIPIARHFVKRYLVEHPACPEAALLDVLLCVTEITTNAVRHTRSGFPGGAFAVTVHLDGMAVRVEVIDEGPINKPEPYDDGDIDEEDLCEGGMGLLLVAAHSQDSGYEVVRLGGKIHGLSWFERKWGVPSALGLT